MCTSNQQVQHVLNECALLTLISLWAMLMNVICHKLNLYYQHTIYLSECGRTKNCFPALLPNNVLWHKVNIYNQYLYMYLYTLICKSSVSGVCPSNKNLKLWQGMVSCSGRNQSFRNTATVRDTIK